MEIIKLISEIHNGKLDGKFKELYPDAQLTDVHARYTDALDKFSELYGNKDVCILSVPGRSEILGNHTDHNHGRVLAAAINLDIIAIVAKSPLIKLKSEGFETDEVDPTKLDKMDSEKYTSKSLIKGICDGFIKNGHKIGGFEAYTVNDVLKGSGLSSSAAFEVMVGHILNHLYNDDSVSPVELAKIGQYAENEYYGKPCGLMDQTACAVGGFVTIDFENPKEPIVKKIDFDLNRMGYSLCVVSTGGTHANLNDEYAAIPIEMQNVAKYFGKSVLRQVDENDFFSKIKEISESCGDRAVLRAMHFFYENKLVKLVCDNLHGTNIESLLSGITASGNSSYKYLQNLYTANSPKEQKVALAVAVSEKVLDKKNAAVRVHGSGFAGTILAIMPKKDTAEYANSMNTIFGEGATKELTVREAGVFVVID